MRTGIRRSDIERTICACLLSVGNMEIRKRLQSAGRLDHATVAGMNRKSEWGGITWSSVKKGENTAFVVHFFKKRNMTNEIQ